MDLDLEFAFRNPDTVVGKSYPQIAEELVQQLHVEHGLTIAEASYLFKASVCRACKLSPNQDLIEPTSAALTRIKPQWIITTNYDLIAEELVSNSTSLLPNQFLIPRADPLPIYHLHGHILSPNDIVITDSDYVRLSSPIEYRQLKLNLLLSESTTIMIGYSLGDVNVKNAMVWSRAFRADWGVRASGHESLIVQVLYKAGLLAADPYYSGPGHIIIETNDILALLNELASGLSEARSAHDRAKRDFEDLLAAAAAAPASSLSTILAILERAPRACDVPTVVRFFASLLDPVWERARADGGWSFYTEFLDVLMDVIVALQSGAGEMHPLLFTFLANRLEDLARFITPDGTREVGTSYEASRRWQERRGELRGPVTKRLRDFADANGFDNLLALLPNVG